MSSIRAAVAARPMWVFFPLVFVLSWYPWVLGMLGVEGADGINPLGVLVAALITAGIAGGWPEARGVLARIGRWRVGLQWYAVALGLPVALAVSAGLIALAAGVPTTGQFTPNLGLLDYFLVAFLFVGLGEEPGWRGYAQRVLSTQHGWIAAALVIAVFHTLWHLPLWGKEFAWAHVPIWAVSVVGASLVLAWLYGKSGESVLLCMLMHAMVNVVGPGYVFKWFAPEHQTVLWFGMAGAWLVCGLALLPALKRMGPPRA
jgi:membrane protease YdiL (CAAX protease family)